MSTTPNPYRQYLGILSKQTARHKAEAGIYSGKPINGYLKVDWTDVHQVDEEKRGKIRLIFREAERKSYRQLLKICEEVGLTNASSGRMGLSSLHNMLTNPFYAGLIKTECGLIAGKHEGSISKTTFETVQKNLRRKRHP